MLLLAIVFQDDSITVAYDPHATTYPKSLKLRSRAQIRSWSMSSSLADCSVGTQNHYGVGFKSIDKNTVQIESLPQLRTGRAATSRVQWEMLPERMDHFWEYTRLEVSKYGLLAHHAYNKALAKKTTCISLFPTT